MESSEPGFPGRKDELEPVKPFKNVTLAMNVETFVM